MFTRFQGYTVLKSVFSSTVSQMQSGLLCSSFSCVTLLREALVYFYSLLRSGLHNQHPLNHFFWARIPSIFLKKMKSYLKTQLCDASSSSMVSQKQKRAFVFKLFLCNPFARSAGILLRAFTRFYALLSQLSSLQFTVYSVWDLKMLRC